ncbi:HET-domain-containing protein [Paraphaeosphaeria sporulosa]|uniref:HET-domain-containing protein n=1 Tax=Paraphaeosphaeria sporulosa TaxID=1460663 RepID=A0A177CEL0_9PLEO|nr:HET-domain-containing protein [Paraphaeosphaeria sporulosa]OAG05218.1 HET-domain-containing protein [Paraphaeosphaeria sporulosa]
MATSNPTQASFPKPHACRHCSTFVVHLPDVSGEDAGGAECITHPTNPSQKRLAVQLFSEDFWTEEWAEYRNYFFQRTSGISFFDATKNDLERFASDGCLLAQRYVASLGDELPEKYAIGARVLKASHWSVELGRVDLEDLRWEMLLAEEEEEPDNTYSLLAREGSAVAQVLDNHEINLQPNAAPALQEAKRWLEACLHNHQECSRPDSTFTPTRLVQISPECRLCEMGTQVEPYAALSYCWGGDQVFKTTMQMRPRYLDTIDSTQLPQTLQDAIYVAQHLGLNYIWIDALCIIQDSIPDKAVEIGRMAQVYGNATITIGATRASAVWNGFLSTRSPLAAATPNMVFALPCQLNGRYTGSVTLLPFTSEGIQPLDTRGWTFQERVLSPRIIDFGTLRTQYTCQTPLKRVPSDGWSHLPLDRAYGTGLDARLIANLLAGLHPPEEMLHHWMTIVEGFTSRGLAFATDKLPAIAGMAEHYGTLLDDQYCAGLWRRGMPANLLWTAGDRIQQIYKDFEPRLSGADVAAPSWSWAAVSRVVTHRSLYTAFQNTIRWSIEIEDCAITLADARTPYGAVSDASLILRAYAKKASWNQRDARILMSAPDTPNVEDFLHSLHGTGSTGIPFGPDALEKEFQEDPKCEMEVWALLFGTDEPDKRTGLNSSFFGLVLRRARDGEGFQRVGDFHKTVAWEGFGAYMAWFEQGGKQQFVVN